MKAIFLDLVSWLPAPLLAIATVVITLFFLFTLLHLIRFVLDLIPFL